MKTWVWPLGPSLSGLVNLGTNISLWNLSLPSYNGDMHTTYHWGHWPCNQGNCDHGSFLPIVCLEQERYNSQGRGTACWTDNTISLTVPIVLANVKERGVLCSHKLICNRSGPHLGQP